ncbi:coagulation factor 5/8 type domain-containing protein, partial [Streptomyces sp. SID8455]|nr:coagulation factor 5/8 type domain-containing protein [Streptomyces sp. SID8455]
IIPDNGVTAIKVGDVDGVKLAGLLVDAGPVNSETLIEVGPENASADHSANPTSLQDVFVRIGGAGPGKATTSIVVNSDDVIIDHT